MWNGHLNLTITESVAILTNDYNKSISTYDMIEEQAMMMADSISSAIVQQFPDKFKMQFNEYVSARAKSSSDPIAFHQCIKHLGDS